MIYKYKIIYSGGSQSSTPQSSTSQSSTSQSLTSQSLRSILNSVYMKNEIDLLEKDGYTVITNENDNTLTITHDDKYIDYNTYVIKIREGFPNVQPKINGEIIKPWYPYLTFIEILKKRRRTTPAHQRLKNLEILKIQEKNYDIVDQNFEDKILKIKNNDTGIEYLINYNGFPFTKPKIILVSDEKEEEEISIENLNLF